MSSVPTDLRYSAEHEWVRIIDGTTVEFGITDHAQDALGDIVFVDLPKVGSTVTSGVSCGEIESTKSVSDIYAPVSGAVTERNDAVETAPETLNSDPYAAGWIARVSVADSAAAVAELLDADAYRALIEG
jgi:glycine cleavage system H protein